MSDMALRENAIRGCKLEDSVVGQIHETCVAEVDNANNMFPGGTGVEIDDVIVNEDTTENSRSKNKSKRVDEYIKQKKAVSGPLLPTEVYIFSSNDVLLKHHVADNNIFL